MSNALVLFKSEDEYRFFQTLEDGKEDIRQIYELLRTNSPRKLRKIYKTLPLVTPEIEQFWHSEECEHEIIIDVKREVIDHLCLFQKEYRPFIAYIESNADGRIEIQSWPFYKFTRRYVAKHQGKLADRSEESVLRTTAFKFWYNGMILTAQSYKNGWEKKGWTREQVDAEWSDLL